LKGKWHFLLLFSVAMNFSFLQEGRILPTQITSRPPSRRFWVQQEGVPQDSTPGLGTQEIPRADKGKDEIYYSVITPEEEKKPSKKKKIK
jgi:hypothetical protein